MYAPYSFWLSLASMPTSFRYLTTSCAVSTTMGEPYVAQSMLAEKPLGYPASARSFGARGVELVVLGAFPQLVHGDRPVLESGGHGWIQDSYALVNGVDDAWTV